MIAVRVDILEVLWEKLGGIVLLHEGNSSSISRANRRDREIRSRLILWWLEERI